MDPTEKFRLLVDLDIIKVQDDYDHTNALSSFFENNRSKFSHVNRDITDSNFPNPSYVLKPGQRLWIRAFEQIAYGTTKSEERMEFLATQNAVYPGAQGSSVVFEQKSGQLPRGKWYSSLDNKEHLWEDAVGNHRVPDLIADSGGGFFWFLGGFRNAWYRTNAFFCFCELEAESSAT